MAVSAFPKLELELSSPPWQVSAELALCLGSLKLLGYDFPVEDELSHRWAP